MYKVGFKEAEEPEIKLPTFVKSERKEGSSRKTSISASLTMLKLLTVWITTDCGKLLEMGIPDRLTCLLRNLCVGQEETDMEQLTGSKLGKMYNKAVYCHSAYLTYIQCQFSSVTQLCPTLCDPKEACQASLSITNTWSLLKLMSIESVMPSNHLILCRPLLLPSIFCSIRVFSSESVLDIRWPKCWCFSISLSNEYSGLISFRIDWFDFTAV